MRFRALLLAALLALVGSAALLAGHGRAAWAPSGPSDRAEVWAVGDGADGSAPARRLAARIRAAGPDRFLYLGDVYDQGTAEEFREHYDPLYGELAARTAPTPGNHEWGNREVGYWPYWQRATGTVPPPYYAFRIAGWQILSLNSQFPHGKRSAQARWLQRRVRSGGTCRIAFWHRARFSAARHGDQPDTAPLWDAVRGRARLVLSGHDHASQRFRADRGTIQLVAGAGGHERYAVRDDPRLRFADDDRYAALRLRLEPGVARFAFVDAQGRVLHAGRVRCQAP